jgi:hypothetical protein
MKGSSTGMPNGHGRIAKAVGLTACLMSTPVWADCNIMPFSQAQPLVERFLMRPDSLPRDYPGAGNELIWKTRAIAATSQAALPRLIRATMNGDARQRRAMADGLAQAAMFCETRDAAHARRIKDLVRRHPDSALHDTFSSHYREQLDTEARSRQQRDAEKAARLAASRAPQSGNMFFDQANPRRAIGDVSRTPGLNFTIEPIIRP